jgi:hypothetical protein
MGVVFRARQKELNRLVALKMLTGHYGPDERARFRAEAETAAHLRHTNIVQIYEVGEDDGAPFFSMEYIETGSLADRLRGNRMPPREGAELMISVARALHFAHENGVVHRDMKPANVLLDRDGVPKVTDFGIAKRLTAHKAALTLSGMVMGTPTYMAPEQAKGTNREVGPAADIYALGAILYEILAGRPPFLPEESETALTLRVITEEPVSPAFYQPGIPGDLETICMKCLEKEPRDRYASAAAFAEDLRRFLDDDSILARPPKTWVRATKWTKRHPWRTSFAVAALFCLGVGLERLWRWEFYQRPHVEYAATADYTVDFVHGGLEPVLKIKKEAISRHGVSLRLTRRGRLGPVTLVEILNSRGNPAVLHPIYERVIPIYIEGLMGAQPNSQTRTESATLEFAYDGEKATETTARDRNGSAIWRIIYDRPSRSQEDSTVLSARFANLRAFEEASAGGASQMELERDATGRDVKVSFFDSAGQPTPNGESVYGYKLVRDTAGRLVRLINLGKDGQPAPNLVGQIERALTWGPAGRVTRVDLCDGAGKPASWNGVTAWTMEYDATGNLMRVIRLGADGDPVRGIDWTVEEIGRSDRGEIAERTISKLGLDGGKSLLRQRTIAYDEFGHPTDVRVAGDMTLHTVRRRDARGNVIEEKYLDSEGQPIVREGYAITRFAYAPGPQGMRIEETYFDADGKQVYNASGYQRVIDELDTNGGLRRQTSDGFDPARFKYHRVVTEPEFDPRGRLRRKTRRFEDASGELVVAATAGLENAASEETFDEQERLLTEWLLGCDIEKLGAPTLRIDSKWYDSGALKRRTIQKCDADRKPIPFASRGRGALTEEDFHETDGRERVYETGFDEKIFGFNVRETRFSKNVLLSVTHKRADGTQLEAVRTIVTAVAPEQPKAAEFKTGDELLSVNGDPVRSARHFVSRDFPGGWIEVLRDGQTLRIEDLAAGSLGLTLEDRAPKN